MTPDEYKNWKATRHSDPGQWDREKCAAADALIKEETIKNLIAYMKSNDYPNVLREYMYIIVSSHFGYAETDYLLMNLGLYPEWM